LIDKHFLNLYNNNWYDILDNEFFSKVEQSWDGRKYSEGRIATCAANCGNFDNRLNNPKLSV